MISIKIVITNFHEKLHKLTLTFFSKISDISFNKILVIFRLKSVMSGDFPGLLIYDLRQSSQFFIFILINKPKHLDICCVFASIFAFCKLEAFSSLNEVK